MVAVSQENTMCRVKFGFPRSASSQKQKKRLLCGPFGILKQIRISNTNNNQRLAHRQYVAWQYEGNPLNQSGVSYTWSHATLHGLFAQLNNCENEHCAFPPEIFPPIFGNQLLHCWQAFIENCLCSCVESWSQAEITSQHVHPPWCWIQNTENRQ